MFRSFVIPGALSAACAGDPHDGPLGPYHYIFEGYPDLVAPREYSVQVDREAFPAFHPLSFPEEPEKFRMDKCTCLFYLFPGAMQGKTVHHVQYLKPCLLTDHHPLWSRAPRSFTFLLAPGRSDRRTTKKNEYPEQHTAASGKHHPVGYIGQKKEIYAFGLKLRHPAVRVHPAGTRSGGVFRLMSVTQVNAPVAGFLINRRPNFRFQAENRKN
jgi:hypothetical protein